ncbi:MAG: phage baseplate protein [Acidobacteriota bacterium]
MQPLTARMSIRAWERGQRADTLGRSLALLSAALPDLRRDELARIGVGQRDALLFRLRELSFGNVFKGFAVCPQCSTRLEFPVDLANFPVDEALGSRFVTDGLDVGGYTVRFRLPDSADLELAARYPTVEEARLALLHRCVLDARHGDQPIAAVRLPEEVVSAISERMETLDPMADLLLEIDCGSCRHQWLLLFDIAAILWREVEIVSKRLLDEVVVLARGYGWSEEEILSMSPARRQHYMERLPSEG